MKTIGIKLADGTFYPILEEGSPKKRMLDLTTAKDNQTKVQIDLYRSETGSMEDAEYVDTLEVTKLNPHPNGEPELHLSVGLDEDNKLTAEVVDPETGKKSETEVTLVSRTLAERAAPADFEITDEHVAEDVSEATFSPDELGIQSTALEDMDFSFDRADGIAAGASGIASSGSEIDSDATAISDTELPVEDTTLESVDFSSASAFSEDAPEDASATADATADFSEETVADTAADPFADTSSDTSENLSADALADFEVPDFDSTVADTENHFADTVDPDATVADDTAVQEEEFSLPDFDDFDAAIDKSSSETSDDSTATTGLNFDDLNDPAFDTSEFETPDFDIPSEKITDSDIDNAFSSFDSDSLTETGDTLSSSGSAMDFSDLYDKETIAGEHASLYDEDEEVKKTRVPVIICIVCAIICVLATILVLFIVPSKYNLIKSRNTRNASEDAVIKAAEPAEVPAPKAEPKEEPKKEPVVIDVKPEVKEEPAPVAVENKIVVAEKPAKVVPAPAPKSEKKPDAKYKIRWGDTLWDISNSYYKTPWKYTKIARYNKIKNPDVIISGTYILIPAE